MAGTREQIDPKEAIKIRSPKIKRQFNRHYDKWCVCNACPLHKNARFHVIGSGRLPVDILFVGEAPGEVENSLGRPFIGPAGRILGYLIKEIESKLRKPFTYAITNTVACLPFPSGEEIAQPSKSDIAACRPRLEEFIEMANPAVIICLGKVAKEAFGKQPVTTGKRVVPVEHVWHPSYLLRCGGQTSFEFRKTVLDLKAIISKALS